MKSAFVAGLALTLTGGVWFSNAQAADIYTQPAPSASYKDTPYVAAPGWAGFYVGLNGGYAFDANSRHGGVLDDGGFGGGQIGYNWQGRILGPNFVFSVEADIQGAGIDSSGTAILTPSGDAAAHHISIDYFGTVRGRIGYAAGPVLFYGTGGFAYGNVDNRFHNLVTGNSFATNNVQTGYAAGGGVEYAFSPAWSFKAEYQYIDLGHDDATGATGNIRTHDQELNTVRGGINYHFGPNYEPLK